MIDKIRDHSRTLVEEVETLTRELVSVSMLWGDIWNEAIDCKYLKLLLTRWRSHPIKSFGYPSQSESELTALTTIYGFFSCEHSNL